MEAFTKWTNGTLVRNIAGCKAAITGTLARIESAENEYQRDSHKQYLMTLEKQLRQYTAAVESRRAER